MTLASESVRINMRSNNRVKKTSVKRPIRDISVIRVCFLTLTLSLQTMCEALKDKEVCQNGSYPKLSEVNPPMADGK